MAQEVKALAAQTAKATEEISTHIAGMQTATTDSVAAIKEIGTTIGRISDIAVSVVSAVEEQMAANRKIVSNVTEASQSTREVTGHIDEVNRGASEIGSASVQVLSSARSLTEQGSVLKREVDAFQHTLPLGVRRIAETDAPKLDQGCRMPMGAGIVGDPAGPRPE